MAAMAAALRDTFTAYLTKQAKGMVAAGGVAAADGADAGVEGEELAKDDFNLSVFIRAPSDVVARYTEQIYLVYAFTGVDILGQAGMREPRFQRAVKDMQFFRRIVYVDYLEDLSHYIMYLVKDSGRKATDRLPCDARLHMFVYNVRRHAAKLNPDVLRSSWDDAVPLLTKDKQNIVPYREVVDVLGRMKVTVKTFSVILFNMQDLLFCNSYRADAQPL